MLTPCRECPSCFYEANVALKGAQVVQGITVLMARYKYRFDIDGYGWSSRFRKLLSSNSLIIKSTVYVSSASLCGDMC